MKIICLSVTINPLEKFSAKNRVEQSESCFLNKIDLEENSDTNVSDVTSSHIDTEVEVKIMCFDIDIK